MPSRGWTYDVFLSFAGGDTREGFVGHLYRALDDKGIYTFRDDLRLRMGDSISDELLNSIEESRISVVVFSEKYASSSWCLDELVKIMDCRKLIGQIVIPVFFNIDPFNVRRQTGVFAEAFWKHEQRNKNDLGKVKKWKEALFEAASISGCHLSVTHRHDESDCIIKIVKETWSKCHRKSSAAKNLVGIIPRMQEVISLLDMTPNDVRIIGIWGMGGAGKTTLAWAVYKEISNQFQGRSYVANIREVSKTSGLHFLQREVLSELLSEPNMKVESYLQGGELMANRLRRKKILLVLDDVDDDGQLDALAGSRDWFGKGSRVIITTRDEHCLKKAKVDEIYTSAILDDTEAIEFFSLNAFERSTPPKEFKEHLDRFVDYAAGLPLALKVLGSFLYGRGIDEWKSTLERLEVSPEEKIDEILRISFDGLRDTEQKIFLDIACFFKGWKRSHATKVLDSFEFCAGIGISVLIQKSLIFISGQRLCMHDRMQEMGWHIVRKVSNNPGEHSRLWKWEDVDHVLTSKTGTDSVEGICLNETQEGDAIRYSSDTFGSMGKLRFLYINTWHIWSLQSKWGFDLSKRFSKETHYPPSNLQWLYWKDYHSNSLPKSFLGEKLVGIELPKNDIIQLWKGRKNLDKLKIINLHSSRFLRSIPDLTGTPNLRSLILDNCRILEEVHPSVGDLKQLVFFSLRDCTKFKSLPSCIQMESLETLDLYGCDSLTMFPEIAEGMGKLSKLYLDGTSIEELPKSIGNLTGLVIMSLNRCTNLRSLPSTICKLICLKTLSLSDCSRLEKLPENLGEIQSLEELSLYQTPIREPPSSILYMKSLKTVSLCCSMTRFLFASNADSVMVGSERPLLYSFGFVKKLIVRTCSLYERDVPDDLSFLFSLEELELSENLFNHLPYSISQLPRLKILDVSRSYYLEAVEELPSTMVILKADHCSRLSRFFDITEYESLWKISLLGSGKVLKRSIEFEFVLQALVEGHLISNHRLSFLGSGDKIPTWFSDSERYDGKHMYLQLPWNWFNGNILGFAICAAFRLEHIRISHRILKIQFDMIEEKIQDFEVPQPSVDLPEYTNMWLGFMSIDFFKMLFPELKQDYWTQFEGKLHVEMDFGYGECQMCAICPLYKDDLEGAATFQYSAGLLDNSTSLPPLKYLKKDDDDDYNYNYNYDDDDGRYPRFGIEDSSLGTVYFDQIGRMSTRVHFDI